VGNKKTRRRRKGVKKIENLRKAILNGTRERLERCKQNGKHVLKMEFPWRGGEDFRRDCNQGGKHRNKLGGVLKVG